MARTKQSVAAAKDAPEDSPRIAKSDAGVKKPTGRPRGRPRGDNPPKVYVPTGRPRGRPKGTTKSKAKTAAVAKAVADGDDAPKRRGRPRKSDATDATPAKSPKVTTPKSTSKRGRPRRLPVEAAKNESENDDDKPDAVTGAETEDDDDAVDNDPSKIDDADKGSEEESGDDLSE
ncbi:hypothetical protein B0J13DRAFT_263200 [Dactylonectria estremocensis]|uniref:Uncharacterized protein n=1 Tax=Dactylonectria estremocensis TaxID=1079267 RepID=A0A9P9JCU2_9HYPO|nr:hypothetical protein B0J13DRAFT_263200 [Dactylonectria estremocensis]